jgi:hypothetical protein
MNNIIIEIKKKSLFIVWFIVGLVVGIGALSLWNHYMIKSPTNIANQADQAKVQEIINSASKLIMLPVGEDPVIATINDAAALAKDQAFYKGAENGDVVLVYQKAAKAIVFSPSRNLVINVGPVFLQSATSTPATVPSTTTTSSTTPKKK